MVDCERHLHITDITKEKTERPTGALVQRKMYSKQNVGLTATRGPVIPALGFWFPLLGPTFFGGVVKNFNEFA